MPIIGSVSLCVNNPEGLSSGPSVRSSLPGLHRSVGAPVPAPAAPGVPTAYGGASQSVVVGPLGINASPTDIPALQVRRDNLFRAQAAAARLFREGRDRELVELGVDAGDLGQVVPRDNRSGYHKVCGCLNTRWSEDGVKVAHS